MGDLCLYLDSTTSETPNDSASPSSSFTDSSAPAISKLCIRSLSYTIHPKSKLTSKLCLQPSPKPINVLKSVSFAANSSGILAIVGPSGAGKSTLLRIISGRVAGAKFDPNAVSLNGQPITSPARLKKMCGFVTQDDNLLPLLTVKETLMFTGQFRLKDVSQKEREERITELMQELGLVHIADSYVGDGERRGISGGERKRVSIGVDVIHDPPILLLDEPTSGLDSSSALQVVELLTSMARARQQILILTIHQPSYRILGYVSTFLLLSRGRVAHCGSLGSLEETITEMGFKIPAQLNALEFAMEITKQLEDHDARPSMPPLDHYKPPTIDGLHSGELADMHVLGGVLPVLGILHTEGEHTQVLGVHVLRVAVQVPAGVDAGERVLEHQGPVLPSGDGRRLLADGGRCAQKQGLETDVRWVNVGIMFGFFLAYRILCWIVLVRKASLTKL